MQKNTAVVFLIVSIVLIAVILLVCRNSTQNKQGDLEITSELREYEGERLSSIYDFRQNAIKGTQDVDINSYKLKITSASGSSREYTYDELISKFKSIKKVVTLYCVEGWEVKVLYEGILVRDLINEVGVTADSKIVIFYSVDGYTTSLPLNYFYNNDIMLAYKINGITLPKNIGFPFQLIAEGKWGYKWARWVNIIEISSDINYQGYWESRGYSNDGDLNKPFFGED